MSSHESSNGGEARGSKRRRIAMACVPCRTRKSRCDGGRPLCQTCRELGFACKYTETGSTANVIVGKEYLSELEQRLGMVEKSIRSINARMGDENTPPELPHHEPLRDSSESVDGADAMGAVIFADESETGYFGPSSNIAFLRTIAEVILEQSNVTLRSPENSGARNAGSQVQSSSTTKPRRDVLPSHVSPALHELPADAEATKMIQSFFSNTGYLFPYIHEGVFMRRYKDMLQPTQQSPSRSWLGLLNIVFAMSLSTQTDKATNAAQRRQQASSYIQKALALCSTQVMRGANLDTLHFLLLWGQYLQGTQKPLEAWTVQGLAVKAAFQLGIHRASMCDKLDPVEREIRKRTWLGCVCLDRTLSMTFGRPPSIPHFYVRDEFPEPYPPDANSLSTHLTVEQLNPGNVSFFAATVKLYTILATIIAQLYAQNLGYDPPLPASQALTPIFTLDARLSTWQRDLPTSLPPITPEEIAQHLATPSTPGHFAGPSAAAAATTLNVKLRTILTLRFLNARILLHRPVLAQCLPRKQHQQVDSTDPLLIAHLAPPSLGACLSSAEATIRIVAAALQHSNGGGEGEGEAVLGAWWFSAWYVFCAGLVVFGTYLASHPPGTSTSSAAAGGATGGVPGVGGVEKERVVELMNLAVGALGRLEGEGRAAVGRCSYCLDILVRYVGASHTSTSGSGSGSGSGDAGESGAVEGEGAGVGIGVDGKGLLEGFDANFLDELFSFHDMSNGVVGSGGGLEEEFGGGMEGREFFGGVGF